MRGVHRSGRKWVACIGRAKTSRYRHLGSFDRFEDAVAARREAEIERFGHVHDSEDVVLCVTHLEVPVFNRTGKRVCYAFVDLADYDLVANRRWCYSGGYAVGRFKKKLERMHCIILNVECDIDHVDRNKMNNMRSNLRPCTQIENSCNAGIRSHNRSGYKGVCFCKVRQKWRVTIKVNNKQKHLGYFINIEEAAKKYDVASKMFHAEFGVTNEQLGRYDDNQAV